MVDSNIYRERIFPSEKAFAYKIAYKKNSDLEELITKSEKLVYSDNIALDEELMPTLETSISDGRLTGITGTDYIIIT